MGEDEGYIAERGLISPFPPLWFSKENERYFCENAFEEDIQVASEKVNLALYSPLYCKSEQRLKLIKGFILHFLLWPIDRCILTIELFESALSKLYHPLAHIPDVVFAWHSS